MIVIKVRWHGQKTGELLYDTHTQAREAIKSSGVSGADASRLTHRDLFAYIGVHPQTGNRYAVWRTRDRENEPT